MIVVATYLTDTELSGVTAILERHHFVPFEKVASGDVADPIDYIDEHDSMIYDVSTMMDFVNYHSVGISDQFVEHPARIEINAFLVRVRNGVRGPLHLEDVSLFSRMQIANRRGWGNITVFCVPLLYSPRDTPLEDTEDEKLLADALVQCRSMFKRRMVQKSFYMEDDLVNYFFFKSLADAENFRVILGLFGIRHGASDFWFGAVEEWSAVEEDAV